MALRDSELVVVHLEPLNGLHRGIDAVLYVGPQRRGGRERVVKGLMRPVSVEGISAGRASEVVIEPIEILAT